MFSHSNADNNLLRCQICANSTDCLPANAPRLFSAEDLLLHIYAHLNYRPHKCNECDFAATSPSELIEHSQKSMHYQLSLYNAENSFLKEICQHILDKCRQKNSLTSAQHLTSAASEHRLPIKQADESSDGAQCSQSASPIPSLSSSANQWEEQKYKQTSTFDESLQNFAAQLNTSAGKDTGVNLSSPKQNFCAFEEAVQQCVRSVGEVLASTPANSNGIDVLDTNKNAFNWTTSQQQQTIKYQRQKTGSFIPSILKCILCGNLPTSNVMREYHCNTHLNLILYRCRLCPDEFTKYNNWRRHMDDQHRLSKPKYARMDANWEKLRNAMKTMFVPVDGQQAIMIGSARQPTSSCSALRALAETDAKSGQKKQCDQPVVYTGIMTTRRKALAKGQLADTALHQHNTQTVTDLMTDTIKRENNETEEKRQNNNCGSGAKKMKTLSKVQCAECDEFLPNTDASRLQHTNVKHLNLCLYMCPVCHKKITSTYKGLGFCMNHIKNHHPDVMLPYDEDVTMADLPEKMLTIRARAAELFALDEQ